MPQTQKFHRKMFELTVAFFRHCGVRPIDDEKSQKENRTDSASMRFSNFPVSLSFDERQEKQLAVGKLADCPLSIEQTRADGIRTVTADWRCGRLQDEFGQTVGERHAH